MPMYASRSASKSSGLQLQVEKEIIDGLARTDIEELPPKPHNFVQFFAAWKKLLQRDKRARYLDQLGSQDYAQVFKHSLEPQVFSEILDSLLVLGDKGTGSVNRHLLGLSRVPRVAALVIFAGQKETAALQKLVATAEAEDGAPDKWVAEIKKCFC